MVKYAGWVLVILGLALGAYVAYRWVRRSRRGVPKEVPSSPGKGEEAISRILAKYFDCHTESNARYYVHLYRQDFDLSLSEDDIVKKARQITTLYDLGLLKDEVMMAGILIRDWLEKGLKVSPASLSEAMCLSFYFDYLDIKTQLEALDAIREQIAEKDGERWLSSVRGQKERLSHLQVLLREKNLSLTR